MPYMNLRPSQVILDPQNPRLPDGTSSDRDACNRLLDEGLIGLARDLARTGQANPAEIPIAIKQGNRYLILEGNRRFAALKLLRDPDLADNEDDKKAIRRAAALGTPPKTVYTLVMDSREEADRWIVLRHTGENNGVGIKRWSASQTATHRRRANKTIDSGTLRSIAIADELEEAYVTDQAMLDLVRRVRREKLTNIGRFFSPDVLVTLRFELVDDKSSLRGKSLLVRHTADQLRQFFVWAFTYIRDHSVDAYKNASIRHGLLQSAAQLLPSPADAAAKPFRLVDTPPTTGTGNTDPPAPEDTAPEDRSTQTGGSTATSHPTGGTTASEDTAEEAENEDESKSRKSEAKPEQYLLQGLKLPNHPERNQLLLKECRALDIEKFPGIACVMIRVIVELSVSLPQILTLSAASEASSLSNKIKATLRYLDPQIENQVKRDRELAQAWLEADSMGIQYLNSFVHNSSVRPDQHLARRFSSAFRPLLVRIDGLL